MKLLVIYFINAISLGATCDIQFLSCNERQKIKIEKNQQITDLIEACHLEERNVTKIKHNGAAATMTDFVIQFNLNRPFLIGKPIQNDNLLLS